MDKLDSNLHCDYYECDEVSVDSGFSSDTERKQVCRLTKKLETSCLPHNAKRGSGEYPNNSNSIPSSRFPDDSAIDWSKVSLSDFEHVRHLGGGGYARVDLLRFTHGHRRKDYYALKKISTKHLAQPKEMKQFETEKKILHTARTRFIPHLYKAFSSHHHVYLLAEACLGGDLFAFLENNGPLKIDVTKFVVACVIEGLEYLHHVLRVIHRDVKTENLLIGKRGVLKLADFGFSKVMQSGGPKHAFTFCGTPGYIAPEVIRHTGHSYAADYFSLGVVTYEAISCRSPFRRHALIDTYKATLRGIEEVAFPSHSDNVTRSFITSLCHLDPDQRLTEKARAHDWFDGFDWSKLQSGDMTSPLLSALEK